MFWFLRWTYQQFSSQICLCSNWNKQIVQYFLKFVFLAYLYLNIRTLIALRTISLLQKSCLFLSHSISFRKNPKYTLFCYFFYYAYSIWTIFWRFLCCVNFLAAVIIVMCIMVVNKFSYRMCTKIKKYVMFLLLEFFLWCKFLSINCILKYLLEVFSWVFIFATKYFMNKNVMPMTDFVFTNMLAL